MICAHVRPSPRASARGPAVPRRAGLARGGYGRPVAATAPCGAVPAHKPARPPPARAHKLRPAVVMSRSFNVRTYAGQQGVSHQARSRRPLALPPPPAHARAPAAAGRAQGASASLAARSARAAADVAACASGACAAVWRRSGALRSSSCRGGGGLRGVPCAGAARMERGTSGAGGSGAGASGVPSAPSPASPGSNSRCRCVRAAWCVCRIAVLRAV